MKTIAKILLLTLAGIIAGKTLFGKTTTVFFPRIKVESALSKKVSSILNNEVYALEDLLSAFDQNHFPGNTSSYLKEIIYSKIPTIYRINGQTNDKTKGNPAKRLIIDRVGFNEISSLNTNLNNVEIIIIKFNAAGELIPGIQLSSLISLPKLKYVFFDFGFTPCSGNVCIRTKTLELITGNIPDSMFVFFQSQITE